MSAPAPVICFKVSLIRRSGESLHRFRGAFTWAEFQSVVSHLWSCRKVRVEYTDEDSDAIAVGSQLEWEECIRLHVELQERSKTTEPLRLRVSKVSGKDGGSGEGAQYAAAATTSAAATAEGQASDDDSSATKPRTRTATVPPLVLPTHVDPVPFAVPAPAAAAAVDPIAAALEGVEKDVLGLLSALFDCNAIAELCDVQSTVDMSAVVRRAVDGQSLEVRLDIDTRAARHHAVIQANRWMDQGKLAESQKLLQAASAVFPHDVVIEYNLACAAALRGEVALSLDSLEKAIADGYRNEAKIRSDEDLAAIRAEPRYAAILAAAFPSVVAEPAAPTMAAPEAAVPVVAPVAPAAVPAPEPIAVDVPPPLTERTQTIMTIFPQMSPAAAKLLLERNRHIVALAVNAKLSE